MLQKDERGNLLSAQENGDRSQTVHVPIAQVLQRSFSGPGSEQGESAEGLREDPGNNQVGAAESTALL